jgi:hypothetical protein
MHFTHYRSTGDFASSLSAIVVEPSRSGAVIVRACRVHWPGARRTQAAGSPAGVLGLLLLRVLKLLTGESDVQLVSIGAEPGSRTVVVNELVVPGCSGRTRSSRLAGDERWTRDSGPQECVHK